MTSASPKSPHLHLVSLEGDKEQTRQEPDNSEDFEAIFVRYTPYVASIGLRLLGRPDEVDDLVQDVFFTAYRKMNTLTSQASIKSWLATIAVRQSWRRLRKRRLWNLIGWENWDAYDTIPDPAALPEVKAQVSALFRVLDTLPPDLRIAWTLQHVQGETQESIAHMCGCSIRTIKRRVSKAQALLKGVWSE